MTKNEICGLVNIESKLLYRIKNQKNKIFAFIPDFELSKKVSKSMVF
jgi:hypothetical protein